MSDFTYENDVSTMSVTRSLAMSSAPAGGLVCIGGAQIGTMITLLSDKTVYIGRDATRCQHVITDAKVSRVHCSFTYVGTINQCRGSVEKRNIFGKRGTPGNRSGVLSETDDQIVYSK